MECSVEFRRFACSVGAAQAEGSGHRSKNVAAGDGQLAAQVGDGKSKLTAGSARLSTTLATGSVTLLHIEIQRGMLNSQLVFEPWTLDMARAKLGRIGMVLPEMLATATR